MSKKKLVLIIALAIGVYIAMGIYADFSQLARVITRFEWMYLVALLGLKAIDTNRVVTMQELLAKGYSA